MRNKLAKTGVKYEGHRSHPSLPTEVKIMKWKIRKHGVYWVIVPPTGEPWCEPSWSEAISYICGQIKR